MKTKGEILRTIEYVILIVVAAIALLPLFWLFVSSFNTDADVIRFPPSFSQPNGCWINTSMCWKRYRFLECS